jgi:glucose-1-phosphate thymidylyltransferase
MSENQAKVVGVIPAAGQGNRLFPYPNAKELFPVGYQQIEIDGRLEKRPKVISQYLVENMITGGVRRFFFVLGRGKYDIMSYYGNGRVYGVHITYLFQERLQGMPLAINLIYPWLQGDETIVMGMPDTVVEPHDAFRKLLQAHQEWQANLTLGLFHTHDSSRFGMIAIDEHYNVIRHIDKPAKTNLEWLWGIACWDGRFMQLMHETLETEAEYPGEVVLGSFFDLALERGLRVKGLPFEDGCYVDIGTYDGLKRALALYA